jgi:flagellar basal body rod protein FlgC
VNIDSKSIPQINGIQPLYFSNISDSDLTTETVNMMIAQRGYEANLNVLKTTEDMTKSVIDILS